jgi:hypothetical protein
MISDTGGKVPCDGLEDGIDHLVLEPEHDRNLHRFVVGWVHPRSFPGHHDNRWMSLPVAYRRALLGSTTE